MKSNKKIIIALSFVMLMQNLVETQALSLVSQQTQNDDQTDTPKFSDTGRLIFFSVAGIIVLLALVNFAGPSIVKAVAEAMKSRNLEPIAQAHEQAGNHEQAQAIRDVSSKIQRVILFDTSTAPIYEILQKITGMHTEQNKAFVDQLMISGDLNDAMEKSGLKIDNPNILKEIKDYIQNNRKKFVISQNAEALKQFKEQKIKEINSKIDSLAKINSSAFAQEKSSSELKTLMAERDELIKATAIDPQRLNDLSEKINKLYSEVYKKAVNEKIAETLNTISQMNDLISHLKVADFDIRPLRHLEDAIMKIENDFSKGLTVEIEGLNKLSVDVVNYHNSMLSNLASKGHTLPGGGTPLSLLLPPPHEFPPGLHPLMPHEPSIVRPTIPGTPTHVEIRPPHVG